MKPVSSFSEWFSEISGSSYFDETISKIGLKNFSYELNLYNEIYGRLRPVFLEYFDPFYINSVPRFSLGVFGYSLKIVCLHFANLARM